VGDGVAEGADADGDGVDDAPFDAAPEREHEASAVEAITVRASAKGLIGAGLVINVRTTRANAPRVGSVSGAQGIWRKRSPYVTAITQHCVPAISGPGDGSVMPRGCRL
jgi:hypothetical protein